MALLTEEFENGAVRTSTTLYRWMTDDEFLSVIEHKFGRSPILDELMLRMARNQDAIDWIRQADDAFETAETEHKKKVEELEADLKEARDQLEATQGQMKVHCTVCDADLTVKL